jgi:hypothetical protein
LVYHVPRYYIAVWPFLALGTASLFTHISGVFKVGKTVALVALTLLLCGLSLQVTYVNRGYDIMDSSSIGSDGAAYGEVADLISTLKPHAKVFCPNPTLCAVSPELVPPYGHDAFALLFMEQERVSDIVDSLEAEGVDFVVLDPWIRVWKGGIFSQADEFQSEVRSRGRLVGVVGSEDTDRFEVYALTGS